MDSASLTQYRLMARAVPRVAPLSVVGATAAVMTLLVISTADPAAVQGRLRLGAACVAASVAFVLDDEAAHTLAGSPATLRARRGVRALVAFGVAAAAFAVMLVLADARSGVGRPGVAYLLEFGAIACIALGVGSAAVGRSDDGRGGAAGALVAFACYASVYLPGRWWWPLTAQPETRRLLVLGVAGSVIAALASMDPATVLWRRAPFR